MCTCLQRESHLLSCADPPRRGRQRGSFPPGQEGKRPVQLNTVNAVLYTVMKYCDLSILELLNKLDFYETAILFYSN